MRPNLQRAPTSAAALRGLRGALLVDRHGDLVWLGEVADASGLTAGFGQVLASAPRRRQDAGVTPRAATIVSAVTVTFKKQGGAIRL
jgi:hypothetical protein